MGDLENLIGHFQVQNQQLQQILLQKQALNMQSKEIEKALENIEEKSEVFRTVGPILIKSTPAEIKKQLEEEKEDIDLKLKSMETQESKLKDKMKENQQKIQGLIPSGQGG